MYSRRDLAKIALGALSAGRLLAKPSSTIRGVTIGVQSRSFRDRTLEEALAAMVQAGIGSCELWEGHVAPLSLSRKGLREWRETIAIEQFQLVASTASKASRPMNSPLSKPILSPKGTVAIIISEERAPEISPKVSVVFFTGVFFD